MRRQPWVILAFGWAIGCGAEEPPPIPDSARPVKTLKVGAADTTLGREWPGRVEPTQNADLAFEVSGKLVEFAVSEGQEVKKGALLARLDARDYRARTDAAKAKYAQVKVEHGRTKSLVDQGVLARSELDLKERQLLVAKADLEQARKALGETRLRAPFSGTIAKVNADNFQNIQAKEAILLLQDSTTLEIVTHIPERDMAAARPGLTIAERNERIVTKAAFDSIPDVVFDCDLKEISTVADPVTQTFEITWSINPPAETNILPGMTAKIVLDNFKPPGDTQGIEIPANAVVGADGGGSFVWQIDPESMAVSKAEVQIGRMEGSGIEITSGLAEGDLIAVSGVQELSDGLVVTRFEDLYGNTERAK